jgi:hypothetical protein
MANQERAKSAAIPTTAPLSRRASDAGAVGAVARGTRPRQESFPPPRSRSVWIPNRFEEAKLMSIGTSLVLIAAGAILRWAVTLHWKTGTVNWHLTGDILMVLGAIGLVLSVIWMASSNRRNTATGDPPPAP